MMRFKFPISSPANVERGKQLEKNISDFLVPKGFEHDHLTGWKKSLPCGLLLCVFNRTNRNHPVVAIEVASPDIDLHYGRRFRIVAPNDVAILTNNWTERLAERIEKFSAMAEEAAKTRCPHCGNFMAEREVKKDGDHKGKKFLGCISYPECRGIRAEWKKVAANDDGKRLDISCPDCGGPLVIRYAKKDGPYQGSRFYGCSRYPECKRIVSPEEAAALKLMGGAPPSPDNR